MCLWFVPVIWGGNDCRSLKDHTGAVYKRMSILWIHSLGPYCSPVSFHCFPNLTSHWGKINNFSGTLVSCVTGWRLKKPTACVIQDLLNTGWQAWDKWSMGIDQKPGKTHRASFNLQLCISDHPCLPRDDATKVAAAPPPKGLNHTCHPIQSSATFQV